MDVTAASGSDVTRPTPPAAVSASPSVWQRWVEPSPALTDESERRTARLLAGLLLLVIPVGLLSAVVQALAVPGFRPAVPLVLGGVLLLSGCYLMARTSRYCVSGLITSLVPIVVGGAVGLAVPDDPAWFAFMTLGTLFASAFLPLRLVAVIAVLTVASASAVLLASGRLLQLPDSVAIVIFVLLVSMLTVVVTRHRLLLERDRERRNRDTETRYRMLFENAPVGIGVADGQGRLIEFNDAMLRPGGYARSDLAAVASVARLYHDPAQRGEILERLGREGRIVGEEVRFLAKDGTAYEVALSLEPITLGGRPHTLAIAEDLTPRKRAEAERARADEERTSLADIIERSLNEIYLFDVTTLRFEHANEGARRNIGYTMEELRALTPVDLKPEFDDASFRAKIAPLLRGETRLLSFETVHRRADGSIYPVEVQLQRAAREGRQLLLAVILDTTARRKAEEAARQEEERLRIAIDTAGLTVFEADSGLRYTWLHQPGLGLSSSEVIGRTDEEVFGTADGRALSVVKRRVLETGRAARQEVHLRYGGRERTCLVSVEPRLSEGGRPAGLRGAWIDISEQKHLQAQFLQAQKLESVGRLAGGVAHDFNNLLTVIKGNLELALDAIGPAADAVRPNLTQATAAADSAAGLTRQLLAFSRRQIIDPQVLSLNDVIARTDTLLRRLIGEHIALDVRTAPDLGLVRFDPGQCEQVLVNLAVNARDAMPDGGTLTLETANLTRQEERPADVDGVWPGEYVMLAVSDTGSGMSADVMAHVFEPFFTTKASGVGTGLGLAMVEGAVSQHHGRIDVASEPGRGTTFRVYLPRVCAAEVSAKPEPVDAMPRGSEIVILVEDDDLVRTLASRLLERQGYTVHSFRDGTAAVEAAGRMSGPLHLLITDVIMPVMNGRAVAEQITALWPSLRVLYTSGYTADLIAHHGVLDPGVEFLAKPYSLGPLARRVREVLDGPAG